jgi:Ca-activated chloride channel family protein
MVNFSFQYPQILLLLLLVPIFILIYFLGITYTKKKAIMFGNFEALQRFSGVEFFSRNFLSLYLNIIILCLFVFAAAGTFVFYDTQTSSFSFVIAVDNSDSMNADDISPNRLSAAKSAAKKFVDLLPMGVEVAVLEFSGDEKIM